MNDQEAEKLLNELWKEWGDRVPDPEVFPQQFMFYVKFLRYLQKSRNPL